VSRRVLIISYYFAPQNAIGAVRPTKLAKYLARQGVEVTVLCGAPLSAARDPLLARDAAGLPDVRVITEHSLLRRWKTRGGTPTQGTPSAEPPASVPARKNPALDAAYLWLSDRADRAFARACIRAFQALPSPYDAVFSCYGPAGVHIAAQYAKKHGVAKKWIADFRDEPTLPFRWQQGRLKRFVKQVHAEADVLTTVSKGTMELMALGEKGRVLPNGFDPDDTQGLPALSLDPAKLHFAYCGQLYAGHSDLSPVFRAVRALCDEGACDASRFCFHYAGRQGEAFTLQAAKYDLGNTVVDHGFVLRAESLALQKAADALLAATWNTVERRGVVTGKVLEYMLADRPVLCCVSGTVPGSDARALVERLHVGAVYEETSDATDLPALKAYLQALYDAKFTGAPNPFQPDREAVSAYDYAQIAQRLTALL
jgi:glycosyltransferase involved in cell wall biosynthesis